MATLGISDEFIRDVREKVTPGTSALFALTSGANQEKVAEEFGFAGRAGLPVTGSIPLPPSGWLRSGCCRAPDQEGAQQGSG
jgi:hypothetical protein